MLNVAEEIKSFKPIDFAELEEKVGRIPSDMKSAIDHYNKALEDVKNHNEDMGVIALKKAIGVYPGFYEAMNLMGLCFSALEDEENARRMFKKVIQLDDSSIKAQRFLDILDGKILGDEGKVKTKARPKAPQAPARTPRNNSGNWLRSTMTAPSDSATRNKSILYGCVGFLAGVLLMGVIWYLVPSGKSLVTYSGPANLSEINTLNKEKDLLETRLKDALDGLTTANKKEQQLRDEIEQYKKWSVEVRTLEALAEEGKYRDVVVEIEKNLVGLDLPQDIMSELSALSTQYMPQAVKQIYDSARKLYDANAKARTKEGYKAAAEEYALAVEFLEKLDTKPSYTNELYYYGGKAIALSDSPTPEEAKAEAIRCFQMVVDAAPNTKLASYSNARINELNTGKTINH